MLASDHPKLTLVAQITNIFSKKILAKRCLREIKLLRHFRGHKNVSSAWMAAYVIGANL
jgi:hypothetical protein